jgi:Heterokaryon incompatibility protein (HET)
MTLSHRWGHQPYTKLESSTMVQLQNAIDITNLPQVFQDAIKIAQHLDIHYLWIDALCIKRDQDDHSDWKSESQNMDKIYSSAFLNVSATTSLDGSESLFQGRSCRPILPSRIQLEVNGLLQNYCVFDGDIWYDDIASAPLNQRGWVFQERFLARKVLHFGQRQMG